MPSYQRDVSIDGKALRQVPWFDVDTVRLDAPPSRTIEKTALADRGGERILSQQYGSKEVTLKGHFFAPTRWDYESGRDKLLSAMNRYKEFTIETEQSGDTRRFQGTYQNCRFDYKEAGLCLVEISFLITGAFGVSVKEDVPVDGAIVVDNFTCNFFVDGSVEAQPIITIAIADIQRRQSREMADEKLRTPVRDDKSIPFTIETMSNNRLSRITVDHKFEAGDVLVVNSDDTSVKLNGSDVFYSGSLPEFLGDTTVTISDKAHARKYSVIISYNKRWL
jgi:hypothetical protein|nr:MAG TPA: tail protein [Caudoviricetes sp.]